MKHLLFAYLLFLSFNTYGQGSVITVDKPFMVDRGKDTVLLGRLSRDQAFQRLNVKEQDYFYWVNKMRSDPAGFSRTYGDPYIRQFPELRSKESRSLKALLEKLDALPMLFPSSPLGAAAKQHSGYLAKSGQLSHTGLGGKDFVTRMHEVGVKSCAGEVIYSGRDDGLIALIILLIDNGVSDLGHRKALVSPEFRFSGVGITYIEDGGAVYVQDFACERVN